MCDDIFGKRNKSESVQCQDGEEIDLNVIRASPRRSTLRLGVCLYIFNVIDNYFLFESHKILTKK